MNTTKVQYWSFEGIQGAIRLPEHTELREAARIFFALWPHDIAEEPPPAGVLLSVHCRGGRFTLSAPWLARPLREPTPTCLLCSLGIEMVSAFRQSHTRTLCLHAAAADFVCGTVLLLGDNRAGKSSLAVRLMASGHRIYGDDLIGVTPERQIFSFGLTPRLRLPLPPSPSLAAFVQRYAGTGDGRYQYVTTSQTAMAPYGATAHIRHAILLQRHATGRARLTRLTPTMGIAQLAGRYIMSHGDAPSVARQATALMNRVPLLCLHYADLDDAAVCLEHYLDTNCPVLPPPEPQCCAIPSPTEPLRSVPQGLDKRLYCRKNGTHLVSHGQQAFLCTPDKDTLYGLNASGQIIWQLLASPISINDVVRLLHKTYPRLPRVRLLQDVIRIFNQLQQADLIQIHDSADCPTDEKNRCDSHSPGAEQACHKTSIAAERD